MLRHRPPDPLNPFRCFRPRAQPSVKPAPSVSHRGALAGRPAAGLGTTARNARKVSGGVAVLQPSTPPFMACSPNFVNPTSTCDHEAPLLLDEP